MFYEKIIMQKLFRNNPKGDSNLLALTMLQEVQTKQEIIFNNCK